MSDELRARAGVVGRRLREDVVGLSDDVTTTLARGIHQLDGDPALLDMLSASVRGNVTNIIDLLSNDIPLSNLQAPTGAIEYALRLAQRDIPSNSLVRAYHMGQNVVLQVIYSEVADMGLDVPESTELTKYLAATVYSYIDWITGVVFEAYEKERQRWAGVHGTALTTTVHSLLAASDASAGQFEGATGYWLDRTHISAVLWLDDDSHSELGELDRVARRSAVAAVSDGPPLVVPVDRLTVWAWVPFRGEVPAAAHAMFGDLPAGVRAAVGQAIPGIHGFRRSHDQALAAFTIASTPRSPTGARVRYDDRGVAVASLLAHDLDATATWVREVLGDLAADSPAMAPLRETLAVYLATGDSHLRTAEHLNLHRNTVKYRIDKALTTIGAHRDRLDLSLALTACEFLCAHLRQR
ncbi:PucR family transcriptional regulator [Gordonia hydrophobica]|uniref:Helix-turn-helix domain-containing protein n=1 Tax=Gordonia hydrophobica TaxID=40516 RepID=A0ABZ2U1U5_9ACTN|nr:helix-turn-helix domain-containing protein [Gordonia hydrophobica]MBM7367229.1 hypothetical protein [Gordonia hydrophobica]